jgi:hypothetical protein
MIKFLVLDFLHHWIINGLAEVRGARLETKSADKDLQVIENVTDRKPEKKSTEKNLIIEDQDAHQTKP